MNCEGRQLLLSRNEAVLAEESGLDGCYVLRTDLSEDVASKETVPARYQDLAQVEQAFRRCKTGGRERRPVHVRWESSPRGHLLVVMLAYKIMRELGLRWSKLDHTVEERLKRLNTYCAIEIGWDVSVLPEPRAEVKDLIADPDHFQENECRHQKEVGSQACNSQEMSKLRFFP